MIGFCSSAYSEPAFRQSFFRTLFRAAEWTEAWGSSLPRSRDTNVLLLLRGLANAFQDDTSLGDSVWAKEASRSTPPLLVVPHLIAPSHRSCTV